MQAERLRTRAVPLMALGAAGPERTGARAHSPQGGKRDKAAFATLVKEGERLAAAGNVLAGAANVERLSADEQILEVLTRIATRKGPVSDALTDAARRYKAGELGRGKAARAFLDAVEGGDLASLERGAGPGERVAGGAGGAGDAARTSGPAAGEEGLAPEPDPNQQTLFQPAYHGSPHRFERFDLHAIGSGEGAQVYGWGLYFAQRRGVAESYREGLSGGQIMVGGRPIQERYAGASRGVRQILVRAWKEEAAAGTESFEIARRVADKLTERVRSPHFDGDNYMRSMVYEAADVAWDIADNGPRVEINEGQLYKVEVPEDDVLLDWEKPFFEQPEAVKAALEQILPPAERRWTSPSGGAYVLQSGDAMIGHVSYANGRFDIAFEDVDGSWRNVQGVPAKSIDEAKAMVEARAQMVRGEKGEDIYRRLVAVHGSPEAASRALNERGVKGLRYLDQGSRAAGEGSYNFVVFDDQAIDVIETYYQRARGGEGGAGSSEPVARLSGRELGDFGDDVVALRAAARDYYARSLRGTSVEHPELGTVHFTQRGGQKALSSSANPLKLKLFPALPEIIRGGRVEASTPNRDPVRHHNVKAFHWVTAEVEIAGERRKVGVTIREDTGGRLYYNHNLQEGESARLGAHSGPTSKAGGGTPGGTLLQGNVGANDDLNITLLGEAGEKGDAPSLPQDARTAVEIGADFRRIILGAKSDKTSFMHESSHVFLWLLRELGTDAEAAPRIRQDWETIRDFLGASDDAPLTREQHEKLASTFERYLAEGKARLVTPGFRESGSRRRPTGRLRSASGRSR